MDVLKLTKAEIREELRSGLFGFLGSEKRTWYVVEPKVLYPSMIAFITNSLAKGLKPSDETKLYYERAKQVPVVGWACALNSKDDCPLESYGARREALEIARLWFTALLFIRTNYEPIGIHILEDQFFRL